ncbi:MAG: 16S rRNA (cytosine(1402)-N(4))-methyltransferase RsmH [Erysipelotrichaceae bacterium]|nr:16S rRNA (cytosine(1402)-N(4))-methyltransferase RsmH [Erysipelotrichaceae bacterium]
MMEHYSVLLNESIELLEIKPDGIYVDGTLGRGGHSSEIAKKLTTGHLYSFDKDQTAIDESSKRLEPWKEKVTLIHSDFSSMKEKLNELGIYEIDGLILDLGVSSPQFDNPERGFSYRFDARLDMRMDQSQDLSAYEVINEYDQKDLQYIFRKYGEEAFAAPIAKKIVEKRQERPIETTFDLVDVIKEALPMKVKAKKGHPAKKVFQSVRIEVNQELSSLEIGLSDGLSMLKKGGRAAVITFHSLEDRIVKEMFVERSSVEKVDKRIPLMPDQIKEADYQLLNKKPILPSDVENTENNRSHSAKLRGILRK